MGAGQAQPAAAFVALDAARKPGEAGPRALRGDAQVGESAAAAPTAGRMMRTAPGQLHVLQAAARRVAGQARARALVQRQVGSQRGQRADVEPAGLELAHGRARFDGRAMAQQQVGRRDTDAAHCGQAQALGSQLVAAVGLARGLEPPADRGQFQQRQIVAQAHGDVGQAQVGGDGRRLQAREREPHSQAAAAARQVDRIVEPVAPDREVGVFEFGVGLALPRIEAGEVGAAQVAAHNHARRQFCRRIGGQGEAVAVAVVLQVELDALQGQWRRSAQFVVPAHDRVLHDHAVLRQQPVGKAALAALGRHVEAGDEITPVAVAADIHVGRDDLQAVQT